jgi:uncharacterized membrane protein YdjX (TVP38/TMEM64 family)
MNIANKLFHNQVKLKSIITLSIYVFLMIITAIIFNKYVDREALQSVVNASGALGVITYSIIEIIYVTLTPLLNTAILIVSGYIFGGDVGFIINFLSTSIGLFIIVLLVKKYGRPLLQKIISSDFYSRFDQLTNKIGPMTLLIVYILPFTPDDELTYVMATGPIKFKRFILPIVSGTLAKSAYSYLGDRGSEGIAIAAYARLIMLIIGVITIGTQEYIIKRNLVKQP